MQVSHAARSRPVQIALLLVLLSVAVFLLRGLHDEREVLRFRDFKQPYASARCLLKGCNPYSEDQTRQVFLQAGGVDDDDQVFQPYSALYPPFSFAVLAPVAALPYRLAQNAWLAVIAALFSLAVLATAELCLPFAALGPLVVLSMFAVSSTILLMLGQISGPVIALLVIGFWCLLRSKPAWIAVILLTVALALKPHDAALPIGYLLFAGPRFRRSFLAIALLTVLIVAGGTFWCASHPASAHWLTDLRANLHGNTSSGNVNDPMRGSTEAVNMANLLPFFAAFTGSATLSGVLAMLVTALLLSAWLRPAIYMPNSVQKHLLALGSMACIMLLPIYHRQYDTRALLLLFPATAVLLAWRKSWGYPAFLLLLVSTLSTAHQFLNRLTLTRHADIHRASRLKTVLLYRPLPETELVVAIVFTAAFYAYYLAGRQRPVTI